MTNLEKTLRKADYWFGKRFREKYTSDVKEKIQRKVINAVAPELKAEDQTWLINYFGVHSLSGAFEKYFAARYDAAQKILELIDGPVDETIDEETTGRLEKVADSCRRFADYIDGLALHENGLSASGLDRSMIEEGFRQAYPDLGRFVEDHLLLGEFIIYDYKKERRKRDERKSSANAGFMAGLVDIMKKREEYTDLLADEILKVQRKYMPKVFKAVLGSVYQGFKVSCNPS